MGDKKIRMSLIEVIADKRNLGAAVAFYQAKYLNSETRRFRPVEGSDSRSFKDFMRDIQKELDILSKELLSGYSFSPYLKRVIVTEDGKRRQVWQPTVRDMVVLKTMATAVSVHLDYALSPQCFSYRTGSDSPTIMDALRHAIRMTRSPRYWVLREDIASYFDNVNLRILSNQLSTLLHDDEKLLDLFRSYLFAPRLERGQSSSVELGLPTGTSPSNFLANLYLSPLDQAMAKLRRRYLRYCDDILVCARTEEEALNSRNMIENTLAPLGLELKKSKRVLVGPGSTFTFLGYEFSSGTPRIGQKAIHKFKNRIRRTTRRKHYQQWHRDWETLASKVIEATNEHIVTTSSGSFVFYFSRCSVADQFHDLDEWIRDRVRGILADSWRRGLRRKYPADWLQSRGLRSLVREYYICRRRSRSSNPLDPM
jgi:retron-type reverse transcriptase